MYIPTKPEKIVGSRYGWMNDRTLTFVQVKNSCSCFVPLPTPMTDNLILDSDIAWCDERRLTKYTVSKGIQSSTLSDFDSLAMSVFTRLARLTSIDFPQRLFRDK
jgi:hypothetical protein